MSAPLRAHRGRLLGAVLLTLLAQAIGPQRASAAPCMPPPPGCIGDACQVGGVLCGESSPPPPRPPGDPAGSTPSGHADRVSYIPTCPGNRPGTGDLCTRATTSCPLPTDFRYWVYVQTWNPAPQSYGEPVRRAQPPFVCAGPAEVAAQDPRAAVLAQVRAEWQTFGLPGSEVVVEPAGDTLVGAKTRFSTGSPRTRTLPPKPIFGLDVTLSIEASGYRWDFGDGTTRDSPTENPQVEHVYRESGPKQVSAPDLLHGHVHGRGRRGRVPAWRGRPTSRDRQCRSSPARPARNSRRLSRPQRLGSPVRSRSAARRGSQVRATTGVMRLGSTTCRRPRSTAPQTCSATSSGSTSRATCSRRRRRSAGPVSRSSSRSTTMRCGRARARPVSSPRRCPSAPGAAPR